MSADNFVAIREFGDGFKWGMFSASDDYPRGFADELFTSDPFPTCSDACRYAYDSLGVIEYGVYEDSAYIPELDDISLIVLARYCGEITNFQRIEMYDQYKMEIKPLLEAGLVEPSSDGGLQATDRAYAWFQDVKNLPFPMN